MIKRKIFSLFLLCFILFIISFQYIPVAKGLTESFTDPQNDIFKVELATGNVEIVSSHDEIDIVNIALDGQYTNVTFAGNITGHDMNCNIYFFEHYNPNNVIVEYMINYSNFTGKGFIVIFIKYTLSNDTYDLEFWNNTIGWTSSNISADIVGTSSDYVIEATIPISALLIHDNITWFAVSTYEIGSYGYLDCAPDSYCQTDETGLPINEIILFIAIAAFVGIGAIYLYKKRKPKKDSFPL
ncbi:MAG: hypothetical protein ACFFBT_12165 [Promethearchaeota archaeon]